MAVLKIYKHARMNWMLYSVLQIESSSLYNTLYHASLSLAYKKLQLIKLWEWFSFYHCVKIDQWNIK